MRLRADLLLFMVAMLWGSAFVAQRVAGLNGSVFFFNGARYLVAASVVAPLAKAWSRPRAAGFDHVQWTWMAFAGTILFLAAALQQAGLMDTTAGNAGFLTSLYVVLVPLVLFLGWRERPSGWTTVSIVTAVVGAFLLSSASAAEVRRGDLLELVGAGFWALHVVLLGKFAARFDALSFSTGQLLVCGLLNLGVGAIFETFDATSLAQLGWAVAYTGMLSLGIGYTVQVWAQRHTPPTEAALILSLESVVAALGGWIFLREVLSPLQLTGCALILLAVVLLQVKATGATGVRPGRPPDTIGISGRRY